MVAHTLCMRIISTDAGTDATVFINKGRVVEFKPLCEAAGCSLTMMLLENPGRSLHYRGWSTPAVE
jgi:hypothetical protein